MAILIGWIVQAAIFGCVVMYGAVGETITERVGHLNLGTPGIMAIGGAFGFIGAYSYENSVTNPNPFLLVIIPLLSAFLAAAVAGLLYAFLTVLELHMN